MSLFVDEEPRAAGQLVTFDFEGQLKVKLGRMHNNAHNCVIDVVRDVFGELTMRNGGCIRRGCIRRRRAGLTHHIHVGAWTTRVHHHIGNRLLLQRLEILTARCTGQRGQQAIHLSMFCGHGGHHKRVWQMSNIPLGADGLTLTF